MFQYLYLIDFFENTFILKQYSFQFYWGTMKNPTGWNISGYRKGNWFPLCRGTNNISQSSRNIYLYQCSTTTSYDLFKFEFDPLGTDGGKTIGLADIEFFGILNYGPCSQCMNDKYSSYYILFSVLILIK